MLFYRYRRALAALILCAAFFAGCGGDLEQLPPPIERDFDAIQARDTLVVLSTYNSTSYFLYRGQALGFEYELLQDFAEAHDLTLQMRVVHGRDSLYTLLNQGVGDVVAARVVPMAADTAHIAFTEPLYNTRPVLVQRTDSSKPGGLPMAVDSIVQKGAPADAEAPIADIADAAPPESIEVRARLIQQPEQLQGKEVSLPQESAYYETLVELSDTLTGDITVVELDTAVSEESVIRHVASGAVNYTVSPANVARLTESYFTNLYIRPVMGPQHRVSWAVRTNAPKLKAALDEWIGAQRDGARMNALYQKYFVDREGYRERVESKYLTGETGTLSDYDDLLRRHAADLGWDWRLLAAQTYQESRFKPRARSWAGAAGLLQLMPPTAREFGVKDVYDPDDNVGGAVRFLQWLTDYWDDHIPDSTERMKFILASYNTGHGHVEDARRLTQKNDGDDTVWADVAYWLLQKSKRSVYEDPVVKYGYSRGLEPVMYVSHILDRFEHYRQFVTDRPGAPVAADPPSPSPPAGR